MSDPWRAVSATKRQKLRARWSRVIASGEVSCPFCGGPVEPGQPWDLDHAVPLEYAPELVLDESNLRPAHRRCNRRAGQRIKTAKHRRRAPRCPGCGGPMNTGADFICWQCQQVVDGVAPITPGTGQQGYNTGLIDTV